MGHRRDWLASLMTGFFVHGLLGFVLLIIAWPGEARWDIAIIALVPFLVSVAAWGLSDVPRLLSRKAKRYTANGNIDSRLPPPPVF